MTAYVTKATTTGGRDGRAILEDGGFGLAMALPKDLGGSGQGMNPEQLFAMGYSSCFGSAILAMSRKHGVDGSKASVTAEVTLEKDEISFALKVAISVKMPGIERDVAEKVLHDAHEICPYSRATRGNVPVTLTLV
jgi:lipoyl-dependent peroxiredoxin